MARLYIQRHLNEQKLRLSRAVCRHSMVTFKQVYCSLFDVRALSTEVLSVQSVIQSDSIQSDSLGYDEHTVLGDFSLWTQCGLRGCFGRSGPVGPGPMNSISRNRLLTMPPFCCRQFLERKICMIELFGNLTRSRLFKSVSSSSSSLVDKMGKFTVVSFMSITPFSYGPYIG